MSVFRMRPLRRHEAVVVLFATLIWGMKIANAETDPLQSLVQTSARRLQVAHKVALAKWYSGVRVEDPSREEEVIQIAVTDGLATGLESSQVAEFFKAQIEANKLIQYCLLADWRRDGRAPALSTADLVKEIRPELDVIEKRLIEELKQSAAARSTTTCPAQVAKAVGEYLNSRSLKIDSLEGVALDRAMASACIR